MADTLAVYARLCARTYAQPATGGTAARWSAAAKLMLIGRVILDLRSLTYCMKTSSDHGLRRELVTALADTQLCATWAALCTAMAVQQRAASGSLQQLLAPTRSQLRHGMPPGLMRPLERPMPLATVGGATTVTAAHTLAVVIQATAIGPCDLAIAQPPIGYDRLPQGPHGQLQPRPQPQRRAVPSPGSPAAGSEAAAAAHGRQANAAVPYSAVHTYALLYDVWCCLACDVARYAGSMCTLGLVMARLLTELRPAQAAVRLPGCAAALLKLLNGVLRYSGVWPAVLARGPVQQALSLIPTLGAAARLLDYDDVPLGQVSHASQPGLLRVVDSSVGAHLSTYLVALLEQVVDVRALCGAAQQRVGRGQELQEQQQEEQQEQPSSQRAAAAGAAAAGSLHARRGSRPDLAVARDLLAEALRYEPAAAAGW
ncbi:hypothetical protein HXX76_001845 [Chlamydomonas incerta]|uniref:phytol kinase n=1 Tax=Chlamydomonas incerta TaxID=51695 RepID=A0A835TGU3_CHLIN|nr:hypothetical protein HXX76_001845 [Chlamydomonas incerta]|eukprot:KAG2443492.1 hypothetical protein HXX76_001845 [Chlamydomonas incerta]